MRTKVVLPLFETDTLGGNMNKYFHDITLDVSHCSRDSACGTKVFIDDKEIRGVTDIETDFQGTIILTMRYDKLITKNPFDNEVDDGK